MFLPKKMLELKISNPKKSFTNPYHFGGEGWEGWGRGGGGGGRLVQNGGGSEKFEHGLPCFAFSIPFPLPNPSYTPP